MKRANVAALAVIIIAGLGYAYWKLAIPTHHVNLRSELCMLGDIDGDNKWTAADLKLLEDLRDAPFTIASDRTFLADLNWNGQIDTEDILILRSLVAAGGDPYVAEASFSAPGASFPRPRELYRYLIVDQYRPPPFHALPYKWSNGSPVARIGGAFPKRGAAPYPAALGVAIYSEAVRLDAAWTKRESGLTGIERDYALGKLARVEALARDEKAFDVLLGLIELVEDAETLTTRGQPDISLKVLRLRDHLRELLRSPQFAAFESGDLPSGPLLKVISQHVRTDVGISCDLERPAKPRDVTNLENYLQRAEWQYYKSTTTQRDLTSLVQFAQNDPRYLRAVSRTSRKLTDVAVENHNLPMVLLFREAMRIHGGDKKKAVGLLDEAIRIPYSWIKAIPRQALPGSVALDNFLLPGNMEDGADKSRHWNVFGGICLYKSPHEALDLALKREAQDLAAGGYRPEALREFLRDMIANLNGMYHVMAVNPRLMDSAN
ncbi:MAG: hypothetical protein IH602_20250 [Bryobacteraceae bacterium]|nr:hypothetical protein [Bryobacteraceae bacterium]